MTIRKAIRALAWPRDRRALALGVAASVEHSACLRRIEAIKTILDIGANRGQFTLEAIKWHPNAAIIAFEPLANECAVMANVLNDVPQITIHSLALGSEDGCAAINISASADSSSILEQTPLQVELFPATANAGQQQTIVRRIDRVLDRASLVSPVLAKIDVQGYELAVLKGFGDLLKLVDYFIVELTNAPFYKGAPNSAEVISYLGSHGYHISNIYNLYFERRVCLQADFLFTRQSI